MAVVRFNEAEFARLLTTPSGPVFRDLRRRGALVEAAAKRRCPVDTGRLRSSITTEVLVVDGQPVARVGTNVTYAPFVEFGTGIYGPRRRRIYPVRAKFLRFKPRGAKSFVFARSVAGMKARPYLRPALAAAGGLNMRFT